MASQLPELQNLVRVRAYASVVCPYPLQDSWDVIRDWGSFAWLPELFGHRLKSALQPNINNDCAVRRTTFGRACVYERLLCLDDMQHLMRWQIINGEPDSQNPFPASLVNYVTAIQLLPVSVGNSTYFAWSGDFWTEASMAAHMKAVFEAMYEAGFKGLRHYLEARSWSPDPVKPSRIPQPCPLCAAAPLLQHSQPGSDLEDSASTGSCCSQSGPETWAGHDR